MDFSKLPFDVSKPGLLIDNYPELLEYPLFSEPDNDLLLKFVILITDENSPIVRREKSFDRIVAAAASYLNMKDEYLLQGLFAGMGGENAEKVFNMQCTYFTLFNNWEFQTWYDLMFQYQENSMVLRTPLNPADRDYEKKAETKQKIRNHQVELQKTLVQYENQIFPVGTNIKRVITKHVAKVTNWPEKMAKEKPEFT